MDGVGSEGAEGVRDVDQPGRLLPARGAPPAAATARPIAAVRLGDMSAAQVLALQRAAGNRTVAGLLGGRHRWPAPRSLARRRTRPKPPPSFRELTAADVTAAVTAGKYVDPGSQLAAGEYGPPVQAGAFWTLNGLNPRDLTDVLQDVGPGVRTNLLAHVADTQGMYYTARLNAALRAASWGENRAGFRGITVLDKINDVQKGPTPNAFGDVWALLGGLSRPDVIAALRVLPRDVLTTLQSHVTDAPTGDQRMLSEILTDLLGSGTDMSAEDVIDVARLRGLDRTMARIYDLRGKLIEEQARALGINTAAAAAIMKVESGGDTFSPATNKSITRFENHILWNRWGRSHQQAFNDHFDFARTGRPFDGHRFREDASGDWVSFHGNQVLERRVLDFAVGLAGDVAYECASFGAGQVMGFNHSMVGYASAKEMADAFDRSEREQITAIFSYIRANSLQGAINSGDFESVARGYNGSGQVDTYAGWMRAAAAAYARVTQAKRNVIR